MKTSKTIATVSAVTLIATAGLLFAGPLNPPAGPVTSTMKTLSEVEPRIAINATNTQGDADSLFKITQPGSYYLTGNVAGVAGKHGIEVVASGVTIDLNGFDLLGVTGSQDGIRANVTGLTSISVINGSVRFWGSRGVNLGDLGAAGSRVEGVVTARNGGIGITIGGGGIVTRCTAYFNGARGIQTGNGCTITDCSATNNTGTGISTLTTCTVNNCSSYSNISHGIDVGNGSTVVDCAVGENDLDGIQCAAGCVIRGNTCKQNGSGGNGAGIHATLTDNLIEGNNCTLADTGIDVDSLGNIIIKNTCSGNTIDWTLAANNVFGPIIDRRTPASAAVSGFAAASTLGTTDPNANFTY